MHNVDVIRAFCDDPWLVGRVAASNATSDLYAKGGRPRHAQAVIGLPDLPPRDAEEILYQVLSGVRETLDAEGVTLLGGHTTLGDDLTVGLSVTGEGPDGGEQMRRAGARPGDALLRLPARRFVLLEGGAAWVCTLFEDMVDHWEQRNVVELKRTGRKWRVPWPGTYFEYKA